MSISRFPVVNNTGVRNLQLRSGLGGVPLLGSVPTQDTINALQAGWMSDTQIFPGYNIQQIENLIALGATDEQLQNLPYGPGTTPADMQAGYAQLYQSLTQNPAAAAKVQIAIQQQQAAAALSSAGSGVSPLLPPGGNPSSQFLLWLEQNSGTILLAVAAIALLPPLVKKL